MGQGPLILMDLDLLASNLGDYETDFVKINSTGQFELFDYLVKNKTFKYAENYGTKVNEHKFMLINSPDNERVRGWFKAKRRYVPVVKYDDFRYGFLNLMRQICDENNYSVYLDNKNDNKGKNYKNSINIVYDLPPNSDGYTEIVFDILLNINSRMREFRSNGEKVDHKVRLFVLSLPDTTIMNVNLNWLDNFLTESGSNIGIDYKYFLVNYYSGKDSLRLNISLKQKLEDKCNVIFLKFGNIAMGSEECHIDKFDVNSYGK